MRLPSPTPIRGLLRCVDAAFFVPSFEEEGYVVLGDLRKDGAEVAGEFVACLAMPEAAEGRLMAWAFGDEQEAQDSTSGGACSSMEAPADAVLARAGRAFDAAWLEAVAPLYALHMGCENMGPLLYSLVRFVKPSCCLEIGAGYTSAFIIQALADNAAEAEAWRQLDGHCDSAPPPVDGAEPPGGGQSSWLAPGNPLAATESSVLHCVDNLAHEGTTAHKLFEVAKRLGLEQRLQLQLDDARAFLAESISTVPEFDFVWLDGLLDFAPPRGGDVGRGIDEFLALVWPRVRPGGFVLLHSTLTNKAVRRWLEGVDAAPWGPPGAVLSLLEPHKRFQNSVSLLQRRPAGYAEPLYSTLP